MWFWDTNSSSNPGRKKKTDLKLIKKNKNNISSNGFCSSYRPQTEKKRKWKTGQIFGRCQGAEKFEEHERDGNTNRVMRLWNTFQGNRIG